MSNACKHFFSHEQTLLGAEEDKFFIFLGGGFIFPGDDTDNVSVFGLRFVEKRLNLQRQYAVLLRGVFACRCLEIKSLSAKLRAVGAKF